MKKMLGKLLGKQGKEAVNSLATSQTFSHPLLSEMWRCTAIPKEEFDLLYVELFKNTRDALNRPPSGGWPPTHQTFDELLAHVFRAMQIRRGYILPLNAAAEDIGKLAEAYTYALVTAILVGEVGRQIGSIELELGQFDQNPIELVGFSPRQKPKALRPPIPGLALLLAPKLIPPNGLTWIYQHREVLTDWLKYFINPRQAALNKIIMESKTYTNRGDLVQENPAPAGIIEEIEQPETIQTPATSETTKRVREIPKGWHIVSKIKEALHTHTLSVNEPGAMIFTDSNHRTLIVTPEIFSWYEEQSGIAAKTAQNQFGRLKIHSTNKKDRNYYKGHLPDDAKAEYKGMVIEDPDVFWTGAPPKGMLVIDI